MIVIALGLVSLLIPNDLKWISDPVLALFLVSPLGLRLIYLSLYPLGFFLSPKPRRFFLALLEAVSRFYPFVIIAFKRASETGFGSRFDHALASLKTLVRIHEVNLSSQGPDTASRPVLSRPFVAELIVVNTLALSIVVVLVLYFAKVI